MYVTNSCSMGKVVCLTYTHLKYKDCAQALGMREYTYIRQINMSVHVIDAMHLVIGHKPILF